ncbi:MAG: ribosomal-processing cysteine protease Prp [Clostridiaceae bacterium]|nr:ribosomal-processing cysteine protease Prp [Clostridiaceae bacterium]
MINVTFSVTEDGLIRSLSVKGHARFDEYGRDIICAASSTLFQTAIHALEELCGLANFYSIAQDVQRSPSKLDLPNDELMKGKDTPSQWILATVKSGFELLEQTDKETYGGKHIRVVSN